MATHSLLLFCGAIACLAIPCIKAEGLMLISKHFSNNSYTCFVRHTKDGLEYHLTYNICILQPIITNHSSPGELSSLQCLYYDCTLNASQLLSEDGELGCFRYAYRAPLSHHSMFEIRRWPVSKFTIVSRHLYRGHSRTKRDFSWVTFLEKISFMGRHQSTVSKQNEAYIHYNFMNKPGGGMTGGSPAPPPPQPTAPAPVSVSAPQIVDPLPAEI